MRLTNTLTGQKEEFTPRDPGKVSMYACGLTPQDAPHIGHIRGAVVMDVARRWFEQLGYEVSFVQNFTDIDDKIINRMAEEGVSAAEIADRYSAMYEQDLAQLGIKPIRFVRVTTDMPDIIAMVEKLVEKGYAYAVGGDVYYSVARFAEYGKLSGRNTEDMKAGARIEVDERKESPLDFALWKSAKPGEPSWDSPWGPGRPGWHIECSTLSLKYLGAGFDIHAGGTDLIFPHHENEIAQSEAYLDLQPFCRYWIHWGAITSGGEKMSKSIGNDAKIRNILDRYAPQSVRLYLLGSSYRSPIDFSLERLDEAQTSLARIQRALESANRWIGGDTSGAGQSAESLWDRFAAAMNDDLNTALAISSLFDAVTAINRIVGQASLEGKLESAAELKSYVDVLYRIASTLGLTLETSASEATSDLLDDLMAKVITWRSVLRQQKQFSLADNIRDDLKKIGIALEDGPTGTIWRKG